LSRLAINIFIILFIGGFIVLNVFVTPKDILFGVRIPSEKQLIPEVKKIRKRFIIGMVGITIIMLILAYVQFRLYPRWSLMFSINSPLIILLVFLFIYFLSWKRAKELKENNNWKTSGKAYYHSPVSEWQAKMSKLAVLVNTPPLVIIIALSILTLKLYHQLPASIPVHFGPNAVPDGWVDKTYWSVFMIPMIIFFCWLVFVFSSYLIVKQKITIDKKDPILSFAQQLVYKQQMLISLGIANTIATILIMPFHLIVLDLISPSSFGVYYDKAFFGILFIAILPMLVVYFRSGERGQKLKLSPDTLNYVKHHIQTSLDTEEVGMELDDDHFWKMGFFYYNPADPSSIIENRFGVGIGFNFARGWVKIATVIGLVSFIILYVLLTVTFLNRLY